MPKGTLTPVNIQIRTTLESDLADASFMLATASTQNMGNGDINWKKRIELLWSKTDIESLLRMRLTAMREGQKQKQRIEQRLTEERIEENINLLNLLWQNSPLLRDTIQKASTQTGEPNIWQTHNFSLTPPCPSWLNHWQMTATVEGQIAGFCELAMLEHSSEFAPAIVNLATAPGFRRRGVATRLIRSAERFARTHWQASTLGLYVEKTNEAALKLYESCGYSIASDDHAFGLLYMTKNVVPISKRVPLDIPR